MPKTVLVADDNHGILSLVEAMLQSKGYGVLTAGDGETALKKTQRMLPDLVILDVKMPKGDGDEVAMILKGDPATKHIPILFLTGLRSEGDEPEPGEENVIPKPVREEILLERVRGLIGD